MVCPESDQGSQFTGALMQSVCKMLEIESITTTPYHPQSNGAVERFHGTLVPMLRKAITKQLDWPKYLPMCLFAVRCSPNRSTGHSPFELLLGHNVRSPVDLVREEIEYIKPQPEKVKEW